MPKKPGMFYGASRIYTLPELDLQLLGPDSLEQATPSQVPLQLSQEGDWGIYGVNAVKFAGPVGSLASNTAINFNLQNQETNEFWYRQGNQQKVTSTPLEHVAGKCGFPGLMTYPKAFKAGSRIFPYVMYTGAVQPTAKSPLRAVLHTVLLKPGMDANKIIIGSRAAMMKNFGGFYTYYTGVFDFSAANPLLPGVTATFEIPIHGKKFMFVDELYCRQHNANFGPNSVDNPLTDELPLSVSVKDTTSLTAWNAPGFAPLWSMFGTRAALPYVPPTVFIVQPLGNIEVSLTNEGTANLEDRMEFTFGGSLIDMPKSALDSMDLG